MFLVNRQLALLHLQRLDERIDSVLAEAGPANIDTYTQAHLNDLDLRIGRALDAIHVVQ